MKTHFNLSPKEYEATRTGHLYERRRAVVEKALDIFPSPRNVLEIGCGTGNLLAHLAAQHPDINFRGVDVDERMVAYAEERYAASDATQPISNVQFTRGDVASVERESGFGLIYSIDVIHHFHHHLDEFRAVRSVLRSPGIWLAIEPNIWHPYVTIKTERMRRAGFDEHHLRPWTIEPLMIEAGFSIASRTYLHALPGNIRTVPSWVDTAECYFERFRCLGGSVVYTLEPR